MKGKRERVLPMVVKDDRTVFWRAVWHTKKGTVYYGTDIRETREVHH